MKLTRRHLDEYEEGGHVVYFSLFFASYGVQRIGDGHRYQIDFYPDLGLLKLRGFAIYKKERKPRFRNLFLINVLGLPFALIFWALFLIVFLGAIYVIGAIEHFTDSFSDVEHKTFNWVNFVLMWVFLFSTIYFYSLT